MITVVVLGFGFIVVLAIVVGIIDARQAPALRLLAAERRSRWEARQNEATRRNELHGFAPSEGWDED